MSATVTRLDAFRERGVHRSAPVSDANWVRQHIRDQLSAKCPATRIDQAIARAERRIAQGCPPERAIRYALSWAVYAADPDHDPPTPPLAA